MKNPKTGLLHYVDDLSKEEVVRHLTTTKRNKELHAGCWMVLTGYGGGVSKVEVKIREVPFFKFPDDEGDNYCMPEWGENE
jgi:hypothetical protein